MVCGDRVIKGNAGIGMQRADFNADFVATNGGNNGLVKRALFSMLPPYSSLRWLLESARNCCGK